MTLRFDDGIVSHFERTKEVAMLFKAICAFQDRTVYTQVTTGLWRAEFHGAFDVVAEGPSLERCRSSLRDAFDERLCEWILSTSDGRGRSVKTRRPSKRR